MMPSIELRLATMRRSLHEVILPAIAADNALAREQAQLLVAHLDLLAVQLAEAATVDAMLARGTETLASALVANAAGGVHTQATAQALRAQLDDGQPCTSTARRAALAAAIDALLGALALDGETACRHAAHDLIVEHALRDGMVERVCFASNGLDPERAELPSLANLLALTR